MSTLAFFLLPPEIGQRLSLNQMTCGEIRKDFKLTSHTHYTLVLRGRNPHICVGNFDSLFGFLLDCVFYLFAWVVLGYREAIILLLLFVYCCSLALFFFFDVFVDRLDGMELGPRHATTLLACTDVG